MEKRSLKLKLKLGVGSPSPTTESAASPTSTPTETPNKGASDMDTKVDEDQQMGSEEEVEEEEWADDAQGEEGVGDEAGGLVTRSRHAHDDNARERHKKSKKKKKKREREKEKDRHAHKHRHHRDKPDGEEENGEPAAKKSFIAVADEVPPVASSLPSSPISPAGTTEVFIKPATEINLNNPASSKQYLNEVLETMKVQLQKKDTQLFFAKPVTDAIAPGYSSIISRPMDFSTIKDKIEESLYKNVQEFISDVKLMCTNCMTYNQHETVYFKSAKRLLNIAENYFSSDKLPQLSKEIPPITKLTKEQLGFEFPTELFVGISTEVNSVSVNTTSEEPEVVNPQTQPIVKDEVPEKLPVNKHEPIPDNMTPEEVLEQVTAASEEATEKLTVKKPASTLGFLRQQGDGTTTLNFLIGCEGNDPNQKEKPVSLGLLTGKLTQGSANLHNYREDKRCMAKPVKPLYYGAYSSFCPSYDSTFANLTKEESEMVYSTYGNDTAVQYAESILDFSRNCDMAMHLVDQLLNILTTEQHSRTTNLIEERRKLQEEDEKINTAMYQQSQEKVMSESVKFEPLKQQPSTNFTQLRSLTDVGIDTSFLKHFEQMEHAEHKMNNQLDENAQLLESLARQQKDRLSRPLPQNLKLLPEPTTTEFHLAEKVTQGLAKVAKQVQPGSLAPVPIIRRALGITMMPINSESAEQIEVDIEGTSTQEIISLPPPISSTSTKCK